MFLDDCETTFLFISFFIVKAAECPSCFLCRVIVASGQSAPHRAINGWRWGEGGGRGAKGDLMNLSVNYKIRISQ